MFDDGSGKKKTWIMMLHHGNMVVMVGMFQPIWGVGNSHAQQRTFCSSKAAPLRVKLRRSPSQSSSSRLLILRDTELISDHSLISCSNHHTHTTIHIIKIHGDVILMASSLANDLASSNLGLVLQLRSSRSCCGTTARPAFCGARRRSVRVNSAGSQRSALRLFLGCKAR